MNIKDLIKEYNLGKDLKKYWEALSVDPMFKKVLALASTKMGTYSPSYSESEVPHIQSERNGGTKGWNRLVGVLLKTPTRENPFGSEDKEKTEEEQMDEFLNQ